MAAYKGGRGGRGKKGKSGGGQGDPNFSSWSYSSPSFGAPWMGDPQMAMPYPGGFGGKGMPRGPPMNSGVARIFQAAQIAEQQAQLPKKLTPKDLLGGWADSLGNAVHVFSTDAYEMRLMATLARPPRPDIHLCIRPVVAGGGWQCGNSMLDPVWTSEKQLHWVTVDGRVSVWVRLYEETKDEPPEKKEEVEKKEVPEAATAEAAKEENSVVEPPPQDGTEEKVLEPEDKAQNPLLTDTDKKAD